MLHKWLTKLYAIRTVLPGGILEAANYAKNQDDFSLTSRVNELEWQNLPLWFKAGL